MKFARVGGERKMLVKMVFGVGRDSSAVGLAEAAIGPHWSGMVMPIVRLYCGH